MINGMILIFELVNFPLIFLMEMFLQPHHMMYISLLIRFAKVCFNVEYFNNRNLFLTAELLKQVYRYHKI